MLNEQSNFFRDYKGSSVVTEFLAVCENYDFDTRFYSLYLFPLQARAENGAITGFFYAAEF